MTAPTENQAVEELKEQTRKIKIEAFDSMRTLKSINLEHTGHKDLGSAFIYTHTEALKRIEKLWADFLKKFPDC